MLTLCGLATLRGSGTTSASTTQFVTRITIDSTDIVAPYDFGFQLRHYVFAPEVREGQMLVEIARLSSGDVVKVDVESRGTVDEPTLELTVLASTALSPALVEEASDLIAWRLGLDDDMSPFYALVSDDPVLTASIEHNFGAKSKSSFTMFDGIIDVICAQNTAFRRLYAMQANLAAAFGDSYPTTARVYYASPTPQQLADAPLDAISACKVGYRDRYIKAIAEMVVGGFDIERLKRATREDARRELMKLPGVGPYTADLGLIIGARRQDTLFLDTFIKQVLRQLYFRGEEVPDEALARFAEERWGSYRGYAWLYLTSNTEVWGRDLEASMRLKSGALSDPDKG
jgi:3-methyladenine DNA glycosylase/8-oxoguanine DNA glycosylase